MGRRVLDLVLLFRKVIRILHRLSTCGAGNGCRSISSGRLLPRHLKGQCVIHSSSRTLGSGQAAKWKSSIYIGFSISCSLMVSSCPVCWSTYCRMRVHSNGPHQPIAEMGENFLILDGDARNVKLTVNFTNCRGRQSFVCFRRVSGLVIPRGYTGAK